MQRSELKRAQLLTDSREGTLFLHSEQGAFVINVPHISIIVRSQSAVGGCTSLCAAARLTELGLCLCLGLVTRASALCLWSRGQATTAS